MVLTKSQPFTTKVGKGDRRDRLGLRCGIGEIGGGRGMGIRIGTKPIEAHCVLINFEHHQC